MRKMFTGLEVYTSCSVYGLHAVYPGSVHRCTGDKWKEKGNPACKLFSIRLKESVYSACVTQSYHCQPL